MHGETLKNKISALILSTKLYLKHFSFQIEFSEV